MAANPKQTVRMRPIILAYLDDLAALGGYGRGRAGVIRRFVENGIVRAIEKKAVEKKNASDFGEAPGTGDEDDAEDD